MLGGFIAAAFYLVGERLELGLARIYWPKNSGTVQCMTLACDHCSSHCILADQGPQPARPAPAGAPAALLFGWLSDKVNRKRLLFAAVVLGALAWPAPAAAYLLPLRCGHCATALRLIDWQLTVSMH